MHIYIGTHLKGPKLIRTRTEPLRNKQVFMSIINLKSAISILL